MESQSSSKTTMAETRGYKVTGNRVLFQKLRHCIYSNAVKKKQGQERETKRPQSFQA